MDTEIDDMFAILSFLKICKMYKKLKRKRPTTKLIAESPLLRPKLQDRQRLPARKTKLKEDPPATPKESIQENRQFCSVVQKDTRQKEAIQKEEQLKELEKIIIENNDSDEENHYDDSDLLSLFETKPQETVETSQEACTDQNYQYEISFEVNGEQRHVVLGNGVQIDEEVKYECPEEDVEICYEEDIEQQEVLLESAEEMHTDQCQVDTEMYFEVMPEEIQDAPDQVLTEVPKKRRRRRRRGQIADQPEENLPVEKKPRTRLFKIRPENLNRHEEGYFGRIFLKIKSDNEAQFILLTRMKRNLFEKLLKLVFKPMSKRAQHIYPEERFSITLLFLAHATPFEVIAKQYKLGKTTVRNIILETCEILYEILAPICLRDPTSEEYLQIAKDFKTLWKLPNCVGVIDGKHVALKKPRRTILEEYNLTTISSLVIMAACDAKHIFRSATVTVEAHQSTFGKGIMNNTLPLPPNGPLVADSTTDFPYYFIGDTTFPLRSNVMRPFAGSSLDDKEILYNYRLSHGQTLMENTFSILTSTWKVLLTYLDLSPLNCEAIMLACIVLHNFLMLNGEDRWRNSDGTVNAELPHDVNEDTEWVNVESVQYQSSLESIAQFGSESNDNGHDLRDALADHFFNEAANETQNELFDV